MQATTAKEQLIEERVERIMITLKRVAMWLLAMVFITMLAVLVMELKREYQIDLIKGVNFSADDWYFDNVQNGIF